MRRDLDRPGLTSGAKIHRCARSVGVADPYRCPVTSSDSIVSTFFVCYDPIGGHPCTVTGHSVHLRSMNYA